MMGLHKNRQKAFDIGLLPYQYLFNLATLNQTFLTNIEFMNINLKKKILSKYTQNVKKKQVNAVDIGRFQVAIEEFPQNPL